jgi:hypothetical protein
LQAAGRVGRIRGCRQLELSYRFVEVTAADGKTREHVEKGRLTSEFSRIRFLHHPIELAVFARAVLVPVLGDRGPRQAREQAICAPYLGEVRFRVFDHALGDREQRRDRQQPVLIGTVIRCGEFEGIPGDLTVAIVVGVRADRGLELAASIAEPAGPTLEQGFSGQVGLMPTVRELPGQHQGVLGACRGVAQYPGDVGRKQGKRVSRRIRPLELSDDLTQLVPPGSGAVEDVAAAGY